MSVKRRYNVGANCSTGKDEYEKMVAVLLRAVPYCMYFITVAAIIITATKKINNRTYMVVHHGVVDAFLAKAAWCGGW